MSKGEATKEKIIEATVKIAMAKGFANTRTAEIAKEAGVSEGLIFKYFPTKNHLFAMILNDNIQRLKSGIQEIIDDGNLNPTAKLLSLIDFHFNFFAIDRNIVQLIFGHSDRKSIVNVESVLQGIHPYLQLIEGILKEGIKSGEFKSFDPEITTLAIIGSMQVNCINKVLLKKNRADLERVKKELTEFILAAIKR